MRNAARPYSKHRNVKTVIDGITFASKAEAKRYGELKLLVKAKEIFDLKCQERFAIIVEGIHVCDYIADFTYINLKKVLFVVEDVKGQKSGAAYAMFRLKVKLMKAVHGIDIVEISKARSKRSAGRR